ncbi:hypothetical protein T06_7505 [Trichinella sp. T6]|nr:hypothetical protein T06_7505 [Trichinella sp. T6]
MRYTGGRDGYCQFSMSRALDAPALAILFPYRFVVICKFGYVEICLPYCCGVVTVWRASCALKCAALCLCLNRLLWICKAEHGVERADVGRHLQAVKQASNQAKKPSLRNGRMRAVFQFSLFFDWFSSQCFSSSFAGNRIVSRWAVIDDDRPSSLLVTATSCWTQRANRFQFTLDSTASSTPCYCKAVAQQRAKFKPAHAAGPRPVMTSRRKQDRPRRVGVDRHRFRHKKGSINMAVDFFFRTVPSMHVCCPFCLSVSVSHVV